MKVTVKILFLLLLSVMAAPMVSIAQPAPSTTRNEGSDPNDDRPLDGIYERTTIKEKRILPYDDIREADVFWEKRIWRVIDVREKMNKPFVYPKEYFVSILLDAAERGELTLYHQADDEFSSKLSPNEAKQMRATYDTTVIYDPVTFQPQEKIVRNELNPEDIKRFRIKEVWFFDEETSTMMVRILGIAPLREVYDEDTGDFQFEIPMFWVYYPDVRKILARHAAFNSLNDAARMSWEDIFEMRYFSSYIIKESNVYNRRIQDYKSGVDVLLESERIRNEIFNFEHDLWSF